MGGSSIFEWVNLIAQNAWLYGGAFILVLSVLVFVHEWGHYIVARMCGVRIDSFSIGFGKELFGVTDKNGTRWKFSIVPLGGYVKMFGDLDPASSSHIDGVEDKETEKIRPLTDEEKKVAFFHKPVAQRCAIVVAGPAINFLFAIVILAGLYLTYGQPVTSPVAGAIVGGSAAEAAGFQPHDEIILIDNTKIRRFEDIRREVMVGLDTERTFTVLRQGQEIKFQATPKRLVNEDRFGFKHSLGLLGLISSSNNAIEIERIVAIDGQELEGQGAVRAVLLSKLGQTFTISLNRGEEIDILMIHPLPEMNTSLADAENPESNYLVIADKNVERFVKHGFLSSIAQAVSETGNVTTSTLKALGQMIVGTRSATELGGLIRIGAIAGDMAQAGIIALITFTALLSINLGLINLFPIPMLDGGHLLFYLVEIIKGSPISDRTQEYAFRLGLALLVGLMLFANLNDIVQLAL